MRALNVWHSAQMLTRREIATNRSIHVTLFDWERVHKMPDGEIGWLADFIYTGGAFESGLAMFADPSGRITRSSRGGADLPKARPPTHGAVLPALVNSH